ncbi:diadenosine tetraphosphatase [Streptomyces sp. YIM 121038]|uniref:metallophosphoesterase n=1 Tax=Streptomyces sp. YIM 121038 TaxID=2136401 RepID=UPI0011654477|nr:metallophosphoesterase [Streptomyces sp. YIM 121038]QCX77740.1 diadenosine tetraphosphatase [Streptomyces sp. YIM 121038]
MTQGAGQGPEVRTATLRDFRVPAYVYEGVRETGIQAAERGDQAAEQEQSAPAPAAGRGPGPAQGQFHAGHAPHAPEAPSGAPGAVPPRVPVQPGPGRHAHAPNQLGHPMAAQAPAVPPEAMSAPAHPGAAGGLPDGYTPTERDLPVINRGDTVQVEVREMPEPPPAPSTDELGPLYVVGDVHGYLDELVGALQAEGLIDADLTWCAGNTRLWFLGDFTDRGPDGIGVIDLVMRLSAEAAAAGGYCKALMGNHELLLIGAKRFGDTPVNSGAGTATFQAAWLLNGGQKTDMERLEDHHLQWMARLDAIEEADGHLLVHSDTTAYLDYGDSIEEVNDTIREALTRNDADEYWDLFRKFTKRFAFRDDSGPAAVRELLDVYGGSRIVHGHSPIPYLLGEVGSEYDGDDDGRPVIEGPHVYADGLAIAMDGGVTMAGKLLVCQLPLAN